MRTSIWDILTGVVLLGTICMACLFATLLLNPAVAFNPFPPPAAFTPVVIPTDTQAPAILPPTWTPSPLPDEGQPGGGDVVVQPTLRPSSTPIPTNTPLILPTFTATRRSGGVGGGNCTVESQTPTDNEYVQAGAFRTSWVLKNTSGTRWRRDSVDVRYMGGTGVAMVQGNPIYDLPIDVDTNALVTVDITMTAPSATGTHTANWALMEGDRTLCRFFVSIRVR